MDSLTAAQRLVILELLAEQNSSLPTTNPHSSRYFWLALTEFFERNPYDHQPTVLTLAIQSLEQSPYITFRVDEQQFMSGEKGRLYILLTRDHAVRVGTRLITLTVGKSIDPLEIIVLNHDHFSSLDISPIKVDDALMKSPVDRLRAIFTALSDVWEYPNTASAVATQLHQRLTDFTKGARLKPAKIALTMPKMVNYKETVDLSKTQVAFIKKLLMSNSPITGGFTARSGGPQKRTAGSTVITNDQYVSLLYELANEDIDSDERAFDALVLDDAALMEDVLRQRAMKQARLWLERAHTNERNRQLMLLGLLRRFADELQMKYDHNTATPFMLLASMTERDRLTLTQRVELHERIIDAMTYNSCSHTRVRSSMLHGAAGHRIREEFFGETSNDTILCKKCNLPFMCAHVGGDIPAAAYTRRVGRLNMCKICGEVLQERLLDDVDEEDIIDEEFQRMIWGRLQYVKERLLGGTSDAIGERNTRKILSFLAKPLYDQYNVIERMRTMRFDLREILQRFYTDIYVIVTLGMMKFRLRGIDGIESIVNFISESNQSNMALLQMDGLRIKAIISSAAKSLSDRLHNVSDVVELNHSLVAINNSVIFRQLMTANITNTDFFLESLTDPALTSLLGMRYDEFRRLGSQNSASDEISASGAIDQFAFVKSRIGQFPRALQPFILWLINDTKRVVNGDEYLKRYNNNLAADSYRAGFRRTGAKYVPKLTWQFWFPGPVDFSLGPTDIYVYRTSAGKLIDVPKSSLKAREGAFVDYRVAPDKLLRDSWWAINYAKAYETMAMAGRGFHLQHVSPASVEAANRLRRFATHRLFVEAYERVCPVKRGADISLHQFAGATDQRCSLCKATYKEITESLEYFAKYETVFSSVYTRPIESGGSQIHATSFGYHEPDKSIAAASSNLVAASTSLSTINDVAPEYWQQLGNLIGRTYETTLELNKKALCPENNSRHRYGIVIGYIRSLYRMIGYVANLNTHGSTYKHPLLYDHARKSGVKLRPLYDELANMIERVGGEPTFAPADGQRFVDGAIAILGELLARVHKIDAELAKILANWVIMSDKDTAVLSHQDFISEDRSTDDYMNDADYRATELRSRRQDDPLFQDFDFEGDENDAVRD